MKEILKKLKVSQLKSIVKKYNEHFQFKNYSSLRKNDLIDLLRSKLVLGTKEKHVYISMKNKWIKIDELSKHIKLIQESVRKAKLERENKSKSKSKSKSSKPKSKVGLSIIKGFQTNIKPKSRYYKPKPKIKLSIIKGIQTNIKPKPKPKPKPRSKKLSIIKGIQTNIKSKPKPKVKLSIIKGIQTNIKSKSKPKPKPKVKSKIKLKDPSKDILKEVKKGKYIDNNSRATKKISKEVDMLMIKFDKYNFNIPYQRKLVWTNLNKYKLIETIYLGHEIPGITVYNYAYNNKEDIKYSKDGKYMYEVLDGKQRSNALYDFYSNKLKVPGKYFPNTPLYKYPNTGFKYEDLSRNLKNVFDDTRLIFREIVANSMSYKQRKQLFNVLQGGKTIEDEDF